MREIGWFVLEAYLAQLRIRKPPTPNRQVQEDSAVAMALRCEIHRNETLSAAFYPFSQGGPFGIVLRNKSSNVSVFFWRFYWRMHCLLPILFVKFLLQNTSLWCNCQPAPVPYQWNVFIIVFVLEKQNARYSVESLGICEHITWSHVNHVTLTGLL